MASALGQGVVDGEPTGSERNEHGGHGEMDVGELPRAALADEGVAAL